MNRDGAALTIVHRYLHGTCQQMTEMNVLDILKLRDLNSSAIVISSASNQTAL